MPYARKTLTELQNDVANDIAASLPGADALLRFSNLNIMGNVQAGLANLHYGYLDWIAKQAVPFTCTDEFLEGWAGFKGALRILATSASGAATFSGANGTLIPTGTKLVRGDGVSFTTTAAATISSGTAVVQATADADPTGLTGAFGNTSTGVVLTLAQAIAGVQSGGVVTSAFVGGADLEKDDSLRTRMLAKFQVPPMGGAPTDYEAWALECPGVTRAWCIRNGFGVGTVVVYVMLDVVQAAHGGFPQGTNGVAAAEWRGTPATGDQLTVANALFALQAAVGLVYVAAPAPDTRSFAIHGIPSTQQDAATAAMDGVFLTQGKPGGTLPFGTLWSAIANVAAGNFFTLTPTDDIVSPAGQIPVLGTVTYT